MSLRHGDAGAHRLPAHAAVLPLVLLRRLGQLLLGLLVDQPRLLDGVDLAQHLAGPLLDPLVGDLFVVEDHQLANRAPAGLQVVAHLDDLLGDGRRARDRLDDRQLAALDALGDFDLAFARQQRHGAHLAQVHPDRVVRLVEGPRRQVQVHARRRPASLRPELLVRIDHLDAGAAERAEQVVQVVRRGDVGPQQVVDLVVEQVALFLADGDQLLYFVELVFDRQGVLPSGANNAQRRNALEQFTLLLPQPVDIHAARLPGHGRSRAGPPRLRARGAAAAGPARRPAPPPGRRESAAIPVTSWVSSFG